MDAGLAVRGAFNPPDQKEFFAAPLQFRLDAGDVLRRDHQDHPHSEVKRAQEFIPLDMADPGKVAKNWRHRPCAQIDHRLSVAGGKRARQIACDAPPVICATDVTHPRARIFFSSGQYAR